MHVTKMHGAGNDYVYVDARTERLPDGLEWPEAARRLADRRFGVGGDGLIAILPPTVPGADARMRIWNADGSEAEMCGNGIRCVAKYLHDKNVDGCKQFRIETAAGVLAVDVEAGPDGRAERARVSMGRPRHLAGPLPLEAAGRRWTVVLVSMGNPHCVLFVDGDVDAFPVETVGPAIERHEAFQNRTNVEFVEVLSRTEVRQRTWERGSGETLACGTGACAVCVAAAATGRTERDVRVHLRGGDLDVSWIVHGEVLLSGPVAEVFEAEVDPAAIARPAR